ADHEQRRYTNADPPPPGRLLANVREARLELGPRHLGRPWSPLAIGVESTHDECVQRRRYSAPNLARRAESSCWRVAREKLIKDRKGCVHVHARVEVLASDALLGRHVEVRAEDVARLRLHGPCAPVLRDAEVEDLDSPLGREDQVLGLEI